MHIYTQEIPQSRKALSNRLSFTVGGAWERLEIALEVAILESVRREVRDRSHGKDRKTGPGGVND
jgi:hypothetical protein